jgi:hypothetical protein
MARLSTFKYAGLALIAGASILAATTVAAQAAPISVNVNTASVLRTTLVTTAENKNVLKIRLRRGVRGHGHLNTQKDLNISAYGTDGTLIATQDKTISKRQTYAHFTLSPEMAKAATITVSLR